MASTKTVRFWFTKFTKGKTHKSILLQEMFSLTEGFIRERFSHFSNNRFFKQTKWPENLVSKKESYSKHKFRPKNSSKLGQMWYRNDVPAIAGRHCSQTKLNFTRRPQQQMNTF